MSQCALVTFNDSEQETPGMEQDHHRKYPRVPADITVEITSDLGKEKTQATMIGGGGLFLGTAQMIEPGTEMTVRFRPAKHLPVIEARARICYQVPEEGLGIEFIHIDPKHREMILRLVHRRLEEKRQYPRAPLATQVEYPQGTLIGFSKDISVGGMFIELNKSIPIGTRLQVLFHLDDDGDALKTEAEVVYSVLKLGVGVRFLKLELYERKCIEAYVATARK
jgi:c-di-GMP-binding flagellar brake protein YcgR